MCFSTVLISVANYYSNNCFLHKMNLSSFLRKKKFFVLYVFLNKWKLKVFNLKWLLSVLNQNKNKKEEFSIENFLSQFKKWSLSINQFQRRLKSQILNFSFFSFFQWNRGFSSVRHLAYIEEGHSTLTRYWYQQKS